MNRKLTFLRAVVLALLLAAPLVAAAGVRAHAGGAHLNQSHAASRAFDSLSLLRSASASVQAAATSCPPGAREEQLALAQEQVLAMLNHTSPTPGKETPADLTVLETQADLAALAALGYSLYSHQQVSFEGRGWTVTDAIGPPEDPVEVKPTPGRPTALFYAPTVPEPGPLPVGNATVTDPRDGFDVPYRLAGWIYAFAFVPYKFAQHPIVGGDGRPFLDCLEREEWFVHERGFHDFNEGWMQPRPPEEDVHGTAPGDEGPQTLPGDISHRRMWDLHVWLDAEPDASCVWLPPSPEPCSLNGVPIVQQANPGDRSIPGRDVSALVGVSPPPNWPDGPYPASYYPQRAADLAVTQTASPLGVRVGQVLTYTITVTNSGPDPATGLTLLDQLPKHADGRSATASRGTCKLSAKIVTCSLGTLAARDAATIDVTIRVNKAGVITNTVSATADQLELIPNASQPERGWTTVGAADDNTNRTLAIEVLP